MLGNECLFLVSHSFVSRSPLRIVEEEEEGGGGCFLTDWAFLGVVSFTGDFSFPFLFSLSLSLSLYLYLLRIDRCSGGLD